jgi:hypothetical protein
VELSVCEAGQKQLLHVCILEEEGHLAYEQMLGFGMSLSTDSSKGIVLRDA